MTETSTSEEVNIVTIVRNAEVVGHLVSSSDDPTTSNSLIIII